MSETGGLMVRKVVVEIENNAKSKKVVDLPKLYKKALQLHQEGARSLNEEFNRLA